MSVQQFLLRFDTLTAKLQQAAVPLPDILLGLHLLYTLNIDEMQRRCIVSSISMEKESVLEDIKSAIRVQKSSLVERKDEKKETAENPTFYSDTRSFRGRSGSRENSNGIYRNNHSYDRRRSNSRGITK